ncbi:hypothetical protein [Saccharopolyspora phatthalungensis]|uniref:Lipoprotein n=1 Tax=Saccharopolyspora phatthalungensis TaxID=664693 RepID=A0A840Q816_9PSEU|nr:hypothetical protein [Saccharopolyspora phatthalungensis]MBB5156077.1 hypothetical protein [Saccharopolyspora phatthalungensis]
MRSLTSLRRMGVLASVGLLAAGCGGNSNLDPAHDRYKALPRICDLVSPATASRVIGASLQTDALSVETTGYCAWTYRDLGSEGAHPLERRLSLHVSLTAAVKRDPVPMGRWRELTTAFQIRTHRLGPQHPTTRATSESLANL